ncbi:MAG: hypothetical protein WCJ92_05465, partial [Alphaproteobacteria bacterium]
MKLKNIQLLVAGALILISMPCNAAAPNQNEDVPKRARTGDSTSASAASSFGDTTAQAVAPVFSKQDELIDGFADLGHGWAILNKVLFNRATAKDFIEKRIAWGCETAINFKIEGLCKKLYGYEENLTEARRLNDDLVAQGNETAINHKIKGLWRGLYGYETNPTEARRLNDDLVAQGNETA